MGAQTALLAPLSAPALEVLGALAPFGHSGPHRMPSLRRFTRLTPAAFETALVELRHRGLVRFEGESLWTTRDGEDLSLSVFS
jgi:DNA-binding IclR family transcriptional regulator